MVKGEFQSEIAVVLRLFVVCHEYFSENSLTDSQVSWCERFILLSQALQLTLFANVFK